MSDFWTNNPMILFEYYYNVIPTQYMSRNEQMNTVTRFAIYFMLLVLLFGVNSKYILYGILVIVVVIIFNYANQYKPYSPIKKLDDKNSKTNEELDIETIFDNPIFGENSYNDKYKNDVESGYIDSDGNYKIGKEYGPFSEREVKNDIKKKKKYRKPTADNPYQNIVFSDYLNDQNVPEPCNVDSPQVQTEAQNLYNSSMFRNTSDVYERQNSQRLFMTMPVTTNPNDQTEFANWLYKTGPTCKENTENCTYFGGPRYESQRY